MKTIQNQIVLWLVPIILATSLSQINGFILNNQNYDSDFIINSIKETINDPDEYSFPNWADIRFQYRKNITIHAPKVHDNLTRFPVLIDLYDEDLKNVQQKSGGDIMFTNVMGSKLPHEVEEFDFNYNSTHGHLVTWVSTNLSSVDNTILYMYYGNPDISTNSFRFDVWDDAYVGVWHFTEDIGPRYDSSKNQNDGSPQQFDANEAVIGKIAGADEFDGIDDFIETYTLPKTLGMEGKMAKTVSAWVNTKSFNNGGIFEFGQKATRSYFSLKTLSTVHQWQMDLGNEFIDFGYASLEDWIYFTVKYDETDINVYVNNELVVNKSIKLNTGNKVSFKIGQSNNNFFHGIIDELRVSTVARLDGWIKTEFENQQDPRRFFSPGSQETDNIAPNVHSLEAEDLGNGTIIFNANLTDQHTEVTSVTIRINSSDYEMIQNEGSQWKFHYSSANYGETLYYQIMNASDILGNTLNSGTQEKTIILNYDNIPPKILNVYFVTNDDLSPTNATFYAEVVEFGPGIDQILLFYYFEEVKETSGTGGFGATSYQTGNSPWLQAEMSLNSVTDNSYVYSASIPLPQEGITWKVNYHIVTIDSSGNIDNNAFTVDPTERKTIIIVSSIPSVDPLLIILSFLVAILGTVIFTTAVLKYFQKPEILGLDENLVLDHIKHLKKEEVRKATYNHTLGIVISIFDDKTGPVPLFVIPKSIDDDQNMLFSLCFRAFSNCEFTVSLDDINQAQFNFKMNIKRQIKSLSYTFALHRPEARNNVHNISISLLVFQDVFPIVNYFGDLLAARIRIIQHILDKEPNEKKKIFFKMIELREFISEIILAYQRIYNNNRET
ncbi:MAG: LamG-like jellyroll fold domain-containing protein [Candidatus Hodarchaeales archaeon]